MQEKTDLLSTILRRAFAINQGQVNDTARATELAAVLSESIIPKDELREVEVVMHQLRVRVGGKLYRRFSAHQQSIWNALFRSIKDQVKEASPVGNGDVSEFSPARDASPDTPGDGSADGGTTEETPAAQQ